MGAQAFLTPLLSFRRVANTPTREGVSPQKTGQPFTLLNLFQNSAIVRAAYSLIGAHIEGGSHYLREARRWLSLRNCRIADLHDYGVMELRSSVTKHFEQNAIAASALRTASRLPSEPKCDSSLFVPATSSSCCTVVRSTPCEQY